MVIFSVNWPTVWAAIGGISVLVMIVVGLVSLWLRPLYKKLGASEEAIRAKEDEIDAVEPSVNARTSGTMTNESQRQRILASEKAPLLRELERLKQERQFIIDKLPFFKS